MTGDHDYWVFGYGSLIWDPGFEPAEVRLATLRGFHRSFCMRSVNHRGSHAEPGLVLALDRAEGASCTGLALRAAPDEAMAVRQMIRERELITSAYLERTVTLETEGGSLDALAYIIDREHGQYCAGLPLDVQAGIIATARGGRGPNDAYLHNTVAALRQRGIEDPEMDRLSEMVRALARG